MRALMAHILKGDQGSLPGYLAVDAPAVLMAAGQLDPHIYLSEGFPGKGTGAVIPRLAVFDRELSVHPSSGYHIAYLFCADGSGVFLSLNQGWAPFEQRYGIRRGREKMKTVSCALRRMLTSPLGDFPLESMDLQSGQFHSALLRSYELGHICGTFYPAAELPEEERLVWDLRNMVGVLRELKGRMRGRSLREFNDGILTEEQIGLQGIEECDTALDSAAEWGDSGILTLTLSPDRFAVTEPGSFVPHKTNYLFKHLKDRKIGLAGEKMVVAYEKKYLIGIGRKDLAQKVEHLSLAKGDGGGYDILSYDMDGNQKFIEVKTTSGAVNAPFELSVNELRFSEKNASSFYLYRLYDFDKIRCKASFFILKGSLYDRVVLKPTHFMSEKLTSP